MAREMTIWPYRGRLNPFDPWHIGYFVYTSTMPFPLIVDSNSGSYPVDLTSVGQSIGVNDMSNTPLFENDLVQVFDNNTDESDGVGVIEYDEETARFIIVLPGLIFDFDSLDGSNVKKVGNLYDNPELLEEVNR